VATNNKDIVGDLPIILSQSIPTALVRYSRDDFAASYAIGNTPWLSAASDQNRISRITTTYQKERIDQGSTAGENSLSNWWLRSATSWHHGAGERYYDADASDTFRFYESNNIDVFSDTGEIKLLPATTHFSTTAITAKPATTNGGTFYIQGNNVFYYNGSTNTATSTSLGTSVVAQTLASDGNSAIVGTNDGIYSVSTALAVTKLWSKPNTATTSFTVQAIGFVKDRIVIGVNENNTQAVVYELSRFPNAAPVTIGNTEERYTFKDPTLVWNSVGEINSAIIVGYTLGAISRVLSFAIDETSPLAAIKDPIVIAELPRGETLNQIRTYLNEYVVMATTAGVRIGNQSTDGLSFVYGALNVSGDVKDIAFTNRFVYATRSTVINTKKGLWKIDLGQAIDNGYAYAADLETDSSDVVGVAFIGSTSRKFMVGASGVWLEHATELATSGVIKSGWIRWGTAEKKQPVSLAVRTDGDGGRIGFKVYDQAGQETVIDSIPLVGSNDFQLSAGLQPADHFEVELTLSRSTTDPTVGPIVDEWQCRALPAPLRSRTLTLPLLCYEEERDPNGVTRVSDPWQRINYLERIEQNGGAVLFQDFSSGEERVCTIRAIQFEQTAPPTFAAGFGGVVTIQLQTIDTELAIQ
jgi:hypothetical protein